MQGSLLKDLPSSCHYIGNFLSEEEQTDILTAISKVPAGRWTQLSHRRLLSLPSQLIGKSRDTLLNAPLPSFLIGVVLARFSDLRVFAEAPHGHPNHCLVNEYRPGQGIMPHEDGPAYFPATATITLGSHTVLKIYRKDDKGQREAEPTWRILQEPGSLLVTSGDLYKDTLHGISEIEADEDLEPEKIVNWELLNDPANYYGHRARSTRISLTYRDVLKVSKAVGFGNKR